MLGNTVGYAAKKRKKPVQKIPKPQPAEGIKSNPSKRHRDRLNNELDRLAALLPFPDEVRSRLDKLSVLRLGVGYLKVKSFFNATLQRNDASWLADRTVALGGNGKSTSSIDGVAISEGDLLLQALNGFVLVVTAEGYVFYASSTVQDYLGFHQSDVVHQSVFEMIHTDDRPMFRRQLHFALNPNQGDSEQETSAQQTSSQISSNIVTYDPQLIPPENSSFLERSFCCRFRCLLDNSSGFLALNFRGRLKYLHGQNQVLSDGTAAHSQLALFAIATPVQTPAILEIRTKTLIFQTKHKLDFSPLGIDTRGKVVLGYSEMELCMKGSGYHFIHAADMMYCADNHMRMIKTGESGFTVFRLLSKSGVWLWVQANARLVFKGGRPDFIVARQRPLTNEEGEENFRKRRLQLPFNCATGKGLLYDTGPNLDMLDPTVPRSANSSEAQALDPKSLLGSMLKQDHSVYIQPPPPDHQLTVDQAFMDSHALLSVPGDSWQQAVPQPSKGPKQDPMVAGIMDSLEQIMGDSTLGAALEELEVKDGELKEWENTLLKMNVGGNNVSMELDGILANDIFSYVEEALFGESASAGSHPVDGNSGSRGLSIPPGCFAQDAALLGERSSQGARIRDYGLPGDDQQGTLIPAMLGGQVQAVPQVDFGGMGEQIHLGGMGRGGGMQEVMRSDPRASIRLNEPTLAQNDGLLSLPQPGLSAQACRSGHNNPMPFSPGLAVPHTQSPVSRGLSVSQTTPGFGSRPQKTLQSAPSTAVGPVQQDLLALSIQNQNQHQLQQQQGIMRKQYERQKRQIFASQSNHAILDSPQDQWNPSIPKCNFEDNLQDVCSPHLPSEYGLSKPSPAQHLRGHFSVETHDLPSEPPHSWQQQQEVLTTACNGFPPTSSNLQNSYGQDCLRDPPLGSLPQISQNWGTAYSYGTQNPMPVPSSSNMNNFMFSNGPQPLENGLCLGGLELGGSVPPYQKLNPLNGQISQQANCGFQNLPGNVLQGPSASSSQGNGLPFSVGPGLPREDAPAQQQFLNCNGQPQIPGHPSEENQPFPFPPVSNGTVYFSENNQTNCCDF